MATCGHSSPTEGCHACWLWLETEVRLLLAVIQYVEAVGLITGEDLQAAFDTIEARFLMASDR